MIYFLIQSVAVLGFIAAWFQGWLQTLVLYDPTGIGQAIACLAVTGSVLMWWSWFRPGSGKRLSVVRQITVWCASLGLLGTLIGVLMALGAFDGAAGGAADAKQIITAFSAGIGVAVRTTIVGTISAVFLQVHMLALLVARRP